MNNQPEKRTVTSDELETQLTQQSPNPNWRFRVRETTCAMKKCNCELIRIDWIRTDQEPMTKIWEAEEIKRRKLIPFAKTILNQLKNAE